MTRLIFWLLVLAVCQVRPQTACAQFTQSRAQLLPIDQSLNPQNRRETLNLEGQIHFSVGQNPNRLPRTAPSGPFLHTIQSGFSPESEGSGIGEQKFIELVGGPEKYYSAAEPVVIDYDFGEIFVPTGTAYVRFHFDGLDYRGEGYLNEEFLGDHEGAYAPFAWTAGPEILAKGRKVPGGTLCHLKVHAQDQTSPGQAIGKQRFNVHDVKGINYQRITGIWRGVYAEFLPPSYLSDILHDGDGAGNYTAHIEIGGERKSGQQVFVEIIDRETGQTVTRGFTGVSNGVAKISLKVPHVKVWRQNEVHLYDIKITLKDADQVTADQMHSYVTMADPIVQAKRHFTDNGQPYYFNGDLDQGLSPTGGYHKSLTEHSALIRHALEDGDNFIRKHQNPPTRAQIYQMEAGVDYVDPVTSRKKHAGLDFWLEHPSAYNLNLPGTLQTYYQQYTEMLLKLSHGHANLKAVLGLNESWGFYYGHGAEATPETLAKAQWKFYQLIDQYGPRRVLRSLNSGWEQVTGIYQGQPVMGVDPSLLILDVHDYASMSGLLNRYADLGLHPKRGQLIPPALTPGRETKMILDGYELWEDSAAVLSEFLGLSSDINRDPNLFTYHQKLKTLEEWAAEYDRLLRTAGHLKFFTGGNCKTQNYDTLQEQNGGRLAAGALKVPSLDRKLSSAHRFIQGMMLNTRVQYFRDIGQPLVNHACGIMMGAD